MPSLSRGDQHDIGVAVEAEQILEWCRLVEVRDNGPSHTGVLTIDTGHLLLHSFAEFLIGVHTFAAGGSKLYENELFGVETSLLQQLIDSLQANFDPFGVVHAVDTKSESGGIPNSFA